MKAFTNFFSLQAKLKLLPCFCCKNYVSSESSPNTNTPSSHPPIYPSNRSTFFSNYHNNGNPETTNNNVNDLPPSYQETVFNKSSFLKTNENATDVNASERNNNTNIVNDSNENLTNYASVISTGSQK